MSKAIHTLLACVAVAALSAVVAGPVAAEPAGPGPGNNPNAEACQKGGYVNLVRSDGTGFQTEGECTSYAARGGTLTPKATPIQQYQSTCENATPPGTFFAISATNADEWVCVRPFFDIGLTESTRSALDVICVDAGGQPGNLPSPSGGYFEVVCVFFH